MERVLLGHVLGEQAWEDIGTSRAGYVQGDLRADHL